MSSPVSFKTRHRSFRLHCRLYSKQPILALLTMWKGITHWNIKYNDKENQCLQRGVMYRNRFSRPLDISQLCGDYRVVFPMDVHSASRDTEYKADHPFAQEPILRIELNPASTNSDEPSPTDARITHPPNKITNFRFILAFDQVEPLLSDNALGWTAKSYHRHFGMPFIEEWDLYITVKVTDVEDDRGHPFLHVELKKSIRTSLKSAPVNTYYTFLVKRDVTKGNEEWMGLTLSEKHRLGAEKHPLAVMTGV
ncbi:hypothetical protein K474DRAFT_849217 [Panus rudis PR-1116 ss-1]|nr:hypothetical protein K474DRAFT_849217 [Panus rudis PR-1116 ss-1]